ncbi:MAG: alanyl-tRNA editing protein [Candidatus Pacearchaeota archaeon]
MQQEALYLQDSYLKEWQAQVIEVSGDKQQFIVLDKTAFYPKGGGQLWDEGKIIRQQDKKEFKVIYTGKFDEKISHEINPQGLKVGDLVSCSLDWSRRYKMMRMHTASHILAGVIEQETGALISGNQLDLDKSRIDFDLETFDKGKMKEFIDKANEIIKKDLKIKISFLPYDEAIKQEELFKLLKGFDKKPEQVRIVEIQGFQKQADGGTHVSSTKEIGRLVFLGAENKGAKRRRIYFTLE